ncbi:hypothetical protein LOTGIDRAFT_164682 [Lottia gigantea]|uniref:Uncharacterized protein n=1 Tax=Lottia gigantea TaxID=225164 RepID=V3ZFP2_LOTGI|nr:hypothetical protein LOTGIDRAFT_164682 [Lottia gigantea]ESO89983.1 hypothetical protein LOTGIDRAFT_164682 [Lottia gigantea]
MDTLLSQSKRDQHRRFEEKLAARRRSKMEREATMGVTRENSSAEQFQKYEEKKAMKKNILENLEKQLEADKERLLSSLRNKTNKMERVKARWKMLAKLNQEQKLLLAEENFESARIVFDMSESALRKEKSFIQERDRHRELAKGRLTSRGSPRKSVEENQQDILKFLEQKPETPKKQKKIKERVMENLYEHHQYEREIFVKLLQLAQQQTELQEKAKNMSEKELKDILTKLQNDQIKIQSDAQQTALTVNLNALTESEQQTYYVGVSKRRSLQFQLYMDAIVYRIEVELRMLKENGIEINEEVIHKELSVSLLADLQERQDNESSVLRNIIVEKDDEMLENICGVQKVGQREGWYKNLSVVIFTLTLSSDDLELLPDITNETKKLEEEFEKQKQEITEKALNSGEDPEPKISELKEKYESKKQGIKEKYERKMLEIREKQAAKKHAKEKKEMKEMEEKELVNMAEMRAKAMKTGGVTLRRKTSVLQDRLSIIREGKKDAEEKEKEKNPRSKSVDAKKSSLLKREKTALDIEVSDGQKQAMFSQIVRQQQNLQSKITDQQKQQEENLQKRLAAKRNQNEQAAALVNLGERQKTILEQKNGTDKSQIKVEKSGRSKSSDRT